ncbi:TRAP transporter small permease [Jannaschia sp. LMIT008]|uniref:TRAP transporter small permease n=1 Tax=Jannaschia maritima TaxID=3032585 RepID=UPI0028115068|nr:TRAP transporter small permease subunit [Jannaschia sp. LMIT008]
MNGTLAGLLALLCVLVAYQVVARYVPAIPPFLWTEEIARLAFMWMIMLGAGLAFADGSHFAFNYLRDRAGRVGTRALTMLALAITLAVMAFFTWSAWELTGRGFSRRSLVTGLPTGTGYAALLMGALVSVGALLMVAWRVLRGGAAPESPIDGAE